MTYLQTYSSPLGELLLAADETGLTGAWFEGQKYFARTLTGERQTVKPGWVRRRRDEGKL